MISFSCADYTFPLLSRPDRFALVRLLGFKRVDVGLFERSADLSPAELLARPQEFIGKLQAELTASQLQVSDVFLQTGADPAIAAANDPSAEVRAHNRRVFQSAVELCGALGCTHLTGLPGVWHEKGAPEDDFFLAVEECQWRQRTAADAGLKYAIEAHVGSICPDIAGTHRLLNAVPGLSLTLDYGHFVWAGISSQEVHSLLPFASHLHARGGASNRLQTSVQENEIDFPGMVDRLLRQSYRGSVAVEYVWTEWGQCNRTDNVSETILLRRQLQNLVSRGLDQAPASKEGLNV